MHDPTKVLLGTTLSSFRVVDNIKGAAVIPAGKVVRRDENGLPSIAKSAGQAIGMSLGGDGSGTTHTAYVLEGNDVPILLTDAFEPVIGAQVAIHDTTGIAATKDGSSTYMNATYKSGVLTGIAEDGSEVRVALIDFPGGL